MGKSRNIHPLITFRAVSDWKVLMILLLSNLVRRFLCVLGSVVLAQITAEIFDLHGGPVLDHRKRVKCNIAKNITW